MAITIVGGGIPLFRALAMRGAIQLEAKGIKTTRRSMRLQAARELGLTGRPNVGTVLAALEAHIKTLEAALQPGDIS